MKTVGLFGFYSWHNFGDDLMAMIYANAIKACGHTPLIYMEKGRDSVPSFRDFATTTNLEDFVSQSERVVIGGGGLLKPETGRSGEIFYAFRNSCLVLTDLLHRAGKPTAAFSIGGDGCGGNIGLHIGIGALMSSPCMEQVSLRLNADLPIFDHLNTLVKVFPDVVFSCPRSLGINQITSPPPTAQVGINLYNRKPDKLLRAALSTLPGVNTLEISTGGNLGKDKTALTYNGDITTFIEGLGTLSLLITCKLHLGVAAIAMGIPTILYFGPPKATCCYREAGLEGNIIDSKIKFLRMMRALAFHPQQMSQARIAPEKVSNLSAAGHQHLNSLSTWVRTSS